MSSKRPIDKAAWAGTALFAVLFAFLLPSRYSPIPWDDGTGPAWEKPLTDRDLEEIRQDTLRVLVLHDALTWEQRGGEETGMEWELLERFAKREKLRIKAVPVEHPDSMLLMLQTGRGDVMAAQLALNGWATPYTDLTRPHSVVKAVKVSLRRDPVAARNAKKGSAGPRTVDTLAVSHWSPFIPVQGRLDSACACMWNWVPEEPEEALVNVLIGRSQSTLLTDAQSTHWARAFPTLAFEPRKAQEVALAFAVRKNAHQLLGALDQWIGAKKEKEARKQLAEAYARGSMGNGPIRTLPAITFGTDSISPFDSLFQAHADSTPVDWKLLAAMGHKESRFDTSATSHAGAEGLMQIMPGTAASLGVDTIPGVSGSIKGATIYLSELDTIWQRSIRDPDQRLKFTLASYNAGPGHIKDAQRIAESLGLDPKRWDGHVERAVLLLTMPRFFMRPEVKNGPCRGHETFWYVRDVLATFGQYRKAGVK